MERRKALKIPFTFDKDNKVSWMELAGCKRRHCDLQHKNGSVLFGHNHVSKKILEGGRKKPYVILPDVLKTEVGKSYLEKIKRNCTLHNRGQMSCSRKHVQRKVESVICGERKSSQRVPNNDTNKNVTPKSRTTSLSSQSSRLRRRIQNVDEVQKEDDDIDEVVIGKDCRENYRFTEVVDCGLSVSWEPAEDTGGCEEFSPASIKERWTDPEKDVLHSLKRKRKGAESKCNGTGSQKRHRESVLRLNGEGPAATHVCLQGSGQDEREERPTPTSIFLVKNGGGIASIQMCDEESGEDIDLQNLDHSIVKFTVGADDPADVLVPILAPNLGAPDFTNTLRQRLLPVSDNTTKTSPSEPIVLSSDDEESFDVPQNCSQAVHTLFTLKDAVIQEESSQEVKQQEASDTEDMQLVRVVVNDVPSEPISFIPTEEYSCMGLAFSNLHCGVYHGKSNGAIMVTDQKLIIPLKDISEQLEVILTVERKELWRYSVWEQQEMEAQEVYFKHDDEDFSPPAVLLLYVSETAAAAAQQQLLKLCVEPDETANTAMASPFMFITLTDPLEGMEGALLRSLLDIDCLNSLACTESIVPCNANGVNVLEDFQAPVLSLDDSIELIRRTGQGSHLLSLLGLENIDPLFDKDLDGLLSDTVENSPKLIQLEGDSEKGTVMEIKETEAQLQPKEDQKEQEVEAPSEKENEEQSPVYTLCHCRTKGSYSVSLCKPDSSWTKYTHEGLAHRLIQFPPPPLKGGITVTMEDLQCLDSGQFLNDVIIDFYLKYLLHKASPAVTERSHIFSSFFYKQLTRRDNASEGNTKDSCQRQRRHQRVKTWTRHVDIFKKDFVFVPVNQEAHWYLVVICFPGLDDPKYEAWDGPESQMGKSYIGEIPELEVSQRPKSPNDDTETPPTLSHCDSVDTETENIGEDSTKDPKPGPVNCTERTCQKKVICKRPCILVMDSLKRSLHERVFKLLRDYLESEWEVRRGSSRDFSAEQMQSSYCKVPLQDNSSDCGLYLLQYVESFLKDPVVHFDLPLRLERWFPRQQVRRKRDEIRDLVLNLYRSQSLDCNR